MKTKMRVKRGKEAFLCHGHTEGKWGEKFAERTKAASRLWKKVRVCVCVTFQGCPGMDEALSVT